MGIAAGAAAGNLGVGLGSSAPGIAGSFQDEDDSTFSQHKTVAIAVEGPRRRGRVGVAPRQSAQVAESRQADRRYGQVAGPGDAVVDQAEPQPWRPSSRAWLPLAHAAEIASAGPERSEPAADPLDGRLVVLVRVEEPRSASEMIVFPEQHPLCPEPEHQADACLEMPAPEAGVAKRPLRTPVSELLEPRAGRGRPEGRSLAVRAISPICAAMRLG